MELDNQKEISINILCLPCVLEPVLYMMSKPFSEKQSMQEPCSLWHLGHLGHLDTKQPSRTSDQNLQS